MNKLIIYLSIFILSIVSYNANAQDCNFYFPTKKGTIVETTSYTKKDKVTSVLNQTVLESSNTGGVQTVKVRNEVKDDKSGTINTSEFSMKCENGNFYVNMESYLNQEQMSAYQGMEIDIDAKDLEMPANLKVGQTLTDGSVTATIRNSGIKMLTMVVNVQNRKVEAFEKITTPAGTFDCVKIYYDVKAKFGFIKVKASGRQWFSKEVGIVKTENYNKKGKLESYSLITKITK